MVVGGVARGTEVDGVVRVVEGEPLADDRPVVGLVEVRPLVVGVVALAGGEVTSAPAVPVVEVALSAGAVSANPPMSPTVAAPAAPAAIQRARAAACLPDRFAGGLGAGATSVRVGWAGSAKGGAVGGAVGAGGKTGRGPEAGGGAKGSVMEAVSGAKVRKG